MKTLFEDKLSEFKDQLHVLSKQEMTKITGGDPYFCQYSFTENGVTYDVFLIYESNNQCGMTSDWTRNVYLDGTLTMVNSYNESNDPYVNSPGGHFYGQGGAMNMSDITAPWGTACCPPY